MNPPTGLPPVELTDGQICLRPFVAEDAPELLATLRSDLKALLAAEDGKPVTLKATANAVKGRVPG